MPVLVVEDGTGVAGANTFADVQAAAAFHAERGGLLPTLELRGTDIAFAAGGKITSATEGRFAGIERSSIVRVRGAGQAANNGFGHLFAAAGVELVADWLPTVDEDAGASVRLTVYERSGWWHASAERLESSLVNGSKHMGKRYPLGGYPVADLQPLCFPRTQLVCGEGSPYYVVGYVFADDELPVGVPECACWLSLADLEEPLDTVIDAREALQSKSVTASGISKVFGGPVRRRRFENADNEVAGLMGASLGEGPFRALAPV